MFQDKIKQVVLWGHKLHTHTHSYIHGAFYKAFSFLGYKTLWLDNLDNISNINFEETLFITEGQVDTNIPIRSDCYYVIHNCDGKKYESILKKNKFTLQVYTHDVIKKHGGKKIEGHEGAFYIDDCLFIVWGTDLLPQEINFNIEKVKNDEIISQNEINFIGMKTEEWGKVQSFCNRFKIPFRESGGFQNNIDYYQNMRLIQQSIIAPAIQTKWQVDNGYVPCRIFKNISYGKMGLTNNITVLKLFNNNIIYHPDIYSLLVNGLNFEKTNKEEKKEIIVKNMEYVRDNHTYLNKIETIFWFFNNVNVNS